MSNPNHLEYYKNLRDYVKHEDMLVNFRLSWMLVVSTGLFSALLFVLKDGQYKIGGEVSTIFFNIICLVGFVTTVATFIGVYAAMASMRSIDRKWKDYANTHSDDQIVQALPPVIGGGASSFNSVTEYIRGISPHLIATTVCIFWISVYIFLDFSI